MPWEDWGLNCSGVLAWLEATTFFKLSWYLFSRSWLHVLPIVHSSAPVDLPNEFSHSICSSWTTLDNLGLVFFEVLQFTLV